MIAVALLFSGEENFGRYLDLYTSHTQYNNLKGLPRHVSYIQYLETLSSVGDHNVVHHELPQETKLAKDYERLVLACQLWGLSSDPHAATSRPYTTM